MEGTGRRARLDSVPLRSAFRRGQSSYRPPGSGRSFPPTKGDKAVRCEADNPRDAALPRASLASRFGRGPRPPGTRRRGGGVEGSVRGGKKTAPLSPQKGEG